MTTLLELSELRVAYGPIEVVRGVSLSVEQGSVSALIGSNGAGKTTSLRAVVGLARLCGGAIWLDGERIDGLETAELARRGIALSPEGRRLFAAMTVRENLLVGAHAVRDRAAARRTFDWVMARFAQLKTRLAQPAGSLSGGEQQMVAIGRALMAQPRVLLLDEPSLGLAPQMVREVARLIREISRELQVTIVLVEQNARLALRLCRRAYVMEQGRIVLSGSGSELLQSPFVAEAYLGIR
ncbi:MAG: ABC transporter ATP-binding protein [Deltaproteobacteria bacterium]|jgi:branched-chain amino acid transport system ATP-binding protein|nr:ABC transporter ATP-binding protein [Deltaproteobacteria bacterium]